MRNSHAKSKITARHSAPGGWFFGKEMPRSSTSGTARRHVQPCWPKAKPKGGEMAHTPTQVNQHELAVQPNPQGLTLALRHYRGRHREIRRHPRETAWSEPSFLEAGTNMGNSSTTGYGQGFSAGQQSVMTYEKGRKHGVHLSKELVS